MNSNAIEEISLLLYRMEIRFGKWIHWVFWTIYGLIIASVFTRTENLVEILGKTSILVILHAGIFYLNALVLMPRYFDQKRYGLYALGILAIVAVSGLVLYTMHELFPPPVRHHHGPNQPGFARIFLRITTFNFMTTFSVLALSLLWYNFKERVRKERAELALKGEKLEADLRQLRAQINPHFLFNALNNIYSLSIDQSEQTPEAIHSLSQMMRYVLFDSGPKMVSIKKEVEYLQNYISLQKLKDDSLENIHFDSSDLDISLEIAPMLLIPFVENCFKHSNYTDREMGYIRIRLSGNKKGIDFECENSIGREKMAKDQVGGIGIDNVKQRLKLIYGDRAKLLIRQEKNKFTVSLKIILHEDQVPHFG